VPLSPSSITW